MYDTEARLQDAIDALKRRTSDQNLALLPNYEQRVEVLKELRFIDDEGRVELKGRVACEINSASELVLTELVLENFFAAYEPEEICALLSAFVFQEKTMVEPKVTPRLEAVSQFPLQIFFLKNTDISTTFRARNKSSSLLEKSTPFKPCTAFPSIPRMKISRQGLGLG